MNPTKALARNPTPPFCSIANTKLAPNIKWDLQFCHKFPVFHPIKLKPTYNRHSVGTSVPAVASDVSSCSIANTKLVPNIKWDLQFCHKFPVFHPIKIKPTYNRHSVGTSVPAVASDVSSSASVSHNSEQNRLERVEENIEKVIYGCRFFAILAVWGSLCGSFLCFVKGCVYVISSFQCYLLDRAKVITSLVEATDVYLLGTVMLVFGMGLYELFISNLDKAKSMPDGRTTYRSNLFGMFTLKERPRWLEINSVNELKTKLGHVIVMLLLIGLFDKSKKAVIQSPADLLCFSASVLLCSGENRAKTEKGDKTKKRNRTRPNSSRVLKLESSCRSTSRAPRTDLSRMAVRRHQFIQHGHPCARALNTSRAQNQHSSRVSDSTRAPSAAEKCRQNTTRFELCSCTRVESCKNLVKSHNSSRSFPRGINTQYFNFRSDWSRVFTPTPTSHTISSILHLHLHPFFILTIYHHPSIKSFIHLAREAMGRGELQGKEGNHHWIHPSEFSSNFCIETLLFIMFCKDLNVYVNFLVTMRG